MSDSVTPPPFYVTTPIYYVNDKPHIGHAYTTLACDVLARFKRLSGHPTYFLTGTDEHGQKVEKSAEKKGIDPQSFTDQVAQSFKKMVHDPNNPDGENLLNASNDDFIRTTEPRHQQGAQAFWQLLEKNGYIYLDKYAGWYSVRDEAYYQESELIDGKAPTGAEVEWVEEESYFFKLSAFEQSLLDLYEQQPDFILPESRRNEVISFVKGGLKDLSISRTTFSWGIPVPDNDKHIMYVWLDALTNYMTAIGYPDTDHPLFKQYWQEVVHIVGKDILRFHAVYWPAFLMAAHLPLPKKIIAHGWWTNEGQKISKSLGNVIDPIALIEEFGLDAVRYFLMREVPFGNDGNYSRTSMIHRINSELSNNIGNLAQRSLSMIQKNCEGKVPNFSLTQEDELLLELAHVTQPQDKIEDLIANSKLHLIIEDILKIASHANEYIDSQAPWKLKKTDPERMQTVLYSLAETIRCIAIMLQPFIPDSAIKLLQLVGYSEEEAQQGVAFEQLKKEYALTASTALAPPQAIFPRFEDK